MVPALAQNSGLIGCPFAGQGRTLCILSVLVAAYFLVALDLRWAKLSLNLSVSLATASCSSQIQH